ncbi:MAG: type I-MYXAN CRISPR-associated protein Cas6/Cmx6 [Leptothrix ochracea]|uniref:type I-MYXAN CRISPR-associated protein Cas6/Cmx6 n=2 Tax=Leptothrix ochracea TaxID=735331 RepID=UPI0034E1CA39
MTRRDREPPVMPTMTDLVFDLDGQRLPPTWRDELAQALQAALPELSSVQVHPLRLVPSGEELLLPRRARLRLRLPQHHIDELQNSLMARELNVGSERLRLTHPRRRPIDTAPTLHTDILVLDIATDGPDTDASYVEAMFEAMLRAELVAIDPMLDDVPLILGKARVIQTRASPCGFWHGFPVVIHDLTPNQSLRLQERGLGAWPWLGLGVLVPHKTITGL